MKFQKGLLDDVTKASGPETSSVSPAAPAVGQAPPPLQNEPVFVEKDRLFQTVQESKRSSGSYLRTLVVVCILIAIGGGVLWYVNRPRKGDKVRVSAAMELALRDHFLLTEKRTATDIAFYQCDGYHWARVGVETRNDIPNPLLRVPTYSAKISPSGESWTISATPITTPEGDVPCR